MSRRFRILFSVCVGCLSLLLAGCTPSVSRQSEEQEPHFVLGIERLNAMDYRGAIEEFQKSLEADPDSAAAHFQLACLYDQQVPDFAAAIYHYEQYLALETNAANADIVRQRIQACKMQLAANVLVLPCSPAAQRQIEEITSQNHQLQTEVRNLQANLHQWRVFYARLMAAQTYPSPNAAESQSMDAPGVTIGRFTHAVASGETDFSIARRYGVSLDALLAANPDMNPRRMAVGTVLKIPPLQPSILTPLREAARNRSNQRMILASRAEQRLD